MTAPSVCGPALERCTCRRRDASIPRTHAEIGARHRESVARAHRTGWAGEPVPGWLTLMLLPSEVEQGWAA